MNNRIKELAEQAETKEVGYYFFDREKFSELIVQECIDSCIKTLEFHGYDEAIPYIEHMAVSKLGLKS